MTAKHQTLSKSCLQRTLGTHRWWLGMSMVMGLAYSAVKLSHLSWLQHVKLSPLTVGIVLGALVGNTVFPRMAKHVDHGVDFAKSWILKAGIILFGFKVTFTQVASVGWYGLIIDASVLGATFLLTIGLAKRVFKLDQHTAILIGAGSSICGAAAVMAVEPVIKAHAHKVSVAVATVVVFGSLSMFLYPFAYPFLGLDEHAYGIFVGSTVHEVAQVVAAGSAVSEHAANIAVIEKMLRVMLLAPFLFALSFWQRRIPHNAATEGSLKQRLFIPWFAVFFILTSGLHSLAVLPHSSTQTLIDVDNALLTMAMVALGLRTHIGAIRQAGLKPLMLGGCLFLFLTLGGFALNYAMGQLV